MPSYQFELEDFQTISVYKMCVSCCLLIAFYTLFLINTTYGQQLLNQLIHPSNQSNCTAASCFWMCHFLED